MLKHTKIVATVSDQRCEVEFIRSLYKAGMNVVRLNSAHMVEEGFNRVVGNTRAVSNHIALLMDTKGPEIRTTKTAQPLELKTGDRIKVMGNPDGETTRECICLSYKNFVADMSVGGELLIDDGDLDLKVIEKHSDYLVCEALNDATLGSRKSVNVPGVRISLPSLTEKDRTSIEETFARLVDLAASLDDEQRRVVEEGLSEEEYALFSLLLRDDLTKTDRERVKLGSMSLLHEIQQLLAPLEQWISKEQTQAEVETFILDHLFMMLPEPPFSAEDKQVAAREVYSYVWNQSAAGHSFAGARA